jgi:hypothetical protein
MLKSLEGEDLRLQNLIWAGELTHQAAEIAVQPLDRSREELLAELQMLELDNPA